MNTYIDMYLLTNVDTQKHIQYEDPSKRLPDTLSDLASV